MFALAFPGQGTLRVGMGAWMRRRDGARAVLDRVDEVLQRPLSELVATGPAEALVDTRNAQLAVTACNLAALELLRDEGIRPAVVAGHSVGEFSALCAAGVLSLEDTLALVRRRSELMAAVSRVGGMASVMKLDRAEVERLAATVSDEREPLVVGIENGRGHTVVSGSARALDRFVAAVDGRAPVTRLAVSNAFHSPLMDEAQEQWREEVGRYTFAAPTVPVIPNVRGTEVTDPAELRECVIEQLTGRVRWTGTLDTLAARGDRTVVEAGDSKALTKIARAQGQTWVTMSDPATVARVRRLSEHSAGSSPGPDREVAG
ncbi:ACP S-malonyltransferase [Dietzia sp. PP-33]|uniref:ACP S-malonyltransferase n=1 Tax=Dietzia sp. PP-33 TaxID=2957500 RepID=UPI0029BBDFE9|nr:ACP S-malonyltransferase [Dietzia sp. PP-33]MDX2358833.1 ACP S-malonyltransferase [Dietzia sp. PP-33]